MSTHELTALEAAFLYAESAVTPMHIGSLSVFDGEGWRRADGTLDIGALRRHIRGRLGAVPRLLQYAARPLGPLGRPYWAEDHDFDIARHVRLVEHRGPVDDAALMELVEQLHMELLDRDHPLWEMWFVDGLSGGRVAQIEKIHHALVDGIGGVDIAMLTLDAEPAPARIPGPDGGAPSRRSGPAPADGARLAARAVVDLVKQPLDVARTAVRLSAHPLSAAGAAWRLAGAATSMAADLRAPHTAMNDPIGTRRRYRLVRTSLDDIKKAAHALGGSVNDAVLCAVSSALHDVLTARGEDLHGSRLHALVPVSTRTASEHDALGNKVSAMIIPLSTDGEDPGDRFTAVHDAVRSGREHHQVELSSVLLDSLEYLPEPLLASASELIHHQFLVNVVVTNVPGPPVPLYLMGSRMLECDPIVPLGRNLSVSIGILSYGNELTFGLWADRDRFPDVDRLADGIERGLATLEHLAAARA